MGRQRGGRYSADQGRGSPTEWLGVKVKFPVIMSVVSIR